MRRFIFTAGFFKGFVEAVYDPNGKLWKLNFTNCQDIQDGHRHSFKIKIPIKADDVLETFRTITSIAVEEKDFDVSYDDFKREYPYKRNTHLAEAYWPKLSSSQQYAAFIGAIEYSKFCDAKGYKNKGSQQFMKLPEKWLKEQQWKNNWRTLY